METSLKLQAPDELEVTMTVKGTIGEFRALDLIIREMNTQSAGTHLWRRPLSTLLESVQMAMNRAGQEFKFTEPNTQSTP